MANKSEKFLAPKFLKYNVHQEKKDVKDANVVKILTALTKLRKELKKNNFNVGRMYAMPSMVHDKDSGMYFAKLETDAECAVWMIREYLNDAITIIDDGTGWDEGSYYWEENIYTPTGLLLSVQVNAK